MLIGFNYIIKTSYDYSFDYSLLLFPLINLLLNLMASFFRTIAHLHALIRS